MENSLPTNQIRALRARTQREIFIWDEGKSSETRILYTQSVWVDRCLKGIWGNGKACLFTGGVKGRLHWLTFFCQVWLQVRGFWHMVSINPPPPTFWDGHFHLRFIKEPHQEIEGTRWRYTLASSSLQLWGFLSFFLFFPPQGLKISCLFGSLRGMRGSKTLKSHLRALWEFLCLGVIALFWAKGPREYNRNSAESDWNVVSCSINCAE